MRSDRILLGIMAGAALGAIAGILLAPEKGTTTRRRIVEAGDGLKNAVQEKVDGLVQSVTEQYENTWRDAQHLVAAGKSKIEDGKHSMKN